MRGLSLNTAMETMASIKDALLLGLLILFVCLAAAADWSIFNYKAGGEDSGGVTTTNYCESWKLNVELNNLRAFDVVPFECFPYVCIYMTTTDQYPTDVEKATETCIQYMCNEYSASGDSKDAWIFDVDDTLLSTLPYYGNHSYGAEKINKSDLDAWKAQGKAPAVQHMVEFYKYIRDRGLKIFLISAREEKLRNVTTENLMNVGYHGWERLILRPDKSPDQPFESVTKYKTEQRSKLMYEEGYRIWGILGDQWSSVLNDHSVSAVHDPSPRRYFKLPNPMYYVF